MLTDLLDSVSGQAGSLRTADFRITSGSSSDGGLGMLSDAVSALAGGSEDDPWHESVWQISVESGCAPFADRAVMDVAPGRVETMLDNELGIELGYGDSGTVPVFGGKVWSVRQEASGNTRLTLVNASHLLCARRVNMTFQNSSTADVARQLASDAGVSAGSLAGTITMPSFVADDRSPLWMHVATLAQWEGMIAMIDADNTLQWKRVENATPVHSFTYGEDLISIEKTEGQMPGVSLRWQGEGAAGGSGREAWCWLSKKADTLGAGGEPKASLVNYCGAFRSSEAVRSAGAGSKSIHIGCTESFFVLAAGVAEAAVGSTVSVTGTPGGELDCTGVVIHVRHLLTKSQGFRTYLEAVVPGGSSGGGVSGGLL